MTSRSRAAGWAVASLLATLLVAACSASGGGAAATSAPAASSAGASAAPSASAAAGSGCPTSQPAALPAGETRIVTINTDKGTIAIEVDADLSPIAAGNFVALADCGFYDGVVFHRVVPGFVIQGGDGEFGRKDAYDPTLVGTGGPGYSIKDEPVTTEYRRGTVAMARSSGPDTVGSQFFIVLDDAAAQSLALPQYNNYQIVGNVSSGMDTVDAIAAAAKGVENPADPIVMDDVSVTKP
jgi:peptidyl-prolyl cis-trans isomerase B (cyclophilin B)